MKIVILGGSGFLGSHVADEFSKRGHKVTIFDKIKSKWIKPNQKMCVGNILNLKDLEKVIKGADAVYHFAALADLNEALKQPINSVMINILGTVMALNLCCKHNVKRFVHASTIYVNSEEGGFYRASKRAAEDYVEEYNKIYGLNYTIIRFGSLYGPRSDNTNGVKRILIDAIKNGRLSYSGSKKTVRRYIHVTDAAKGCVQSLKNKYKNRHIIITGKKEIKIKDLLNKVSRILDISKKINFKNRSSTGHYETNPYTFRFKKGETFKYKTKVDIYKEILKIIKEIKKK
jgi:UDP-glucose 4-epimerase